MVEDPEGPSEEEDLGEAVWIRPRDERLWIGDTAPDDEYVAVADIPLPDGSQYTSTLEGVATWAEGGKDGALSADYNQFDHRVRIYGDTLEALEEAMADLGVSGYFDLDLDEDDLTLHVTFNDDPDSLDPDLVDLDYVNKKRPGGGGGGNGPPPPPPPPPPLPDPPYPGPEGGFSVPFDGVPSIPPPPNGEGEGPSGGGDVPGAAAQAVDDSLHEGATETDAEGSDPSEVVTKANEAIDAANEAMRSFAQGDEEEGISKALESAELAEECSSMADTRSTIQRKAAKQAQDAAQRCLGCGKECCCDDPDLEDACSLMETAEADVADLDDTPDLGNLQDSLDELRECLNSATHQAEQEAILDSMMGDLKEAYDLLDPFDRDQATQFRDMANQMDSANDNYGEPDPQAQRREEIDELRQQLREDLRRYGAFDPASREYHKDPETGKTQTWETVEETAQAIQDQNLEGHVPLEHYGDGWEQFLEYDDMDFPDDWQRFKQAYDEHYLEELHPIDAAPVFGEGLPSVMEVGEVTVGEETPVLAPFQPQRRPPIPYVDPETGEVSFHRAGEQPEHLKVVSLTHETGEEDQSNKDIVVPGTLEGIREWVLRSPKGDAAVISLEGGTLILEGDTQRWTEAIEGMETAFEVTQEGDRLVVRYED